MSYNIISKKRAFTLIEMSVVLLILGAVVFSITSGVNNLITSAKLSSARSFTESSAVSEIDNMVFWLDSTSKEAFDAQPKDGGEVTQWNDVSGTNLMVQSGRGGGVGGNNLIQSGAVAVPVFESNGIGGLPSVSFVQQKLITSGVDPLLNSTEYTIFIVARANADQTNQTNNILCIMSSRVGSPTFDSGYDFCIRNNSNNFLMNHVNSGDQTSLTHSGTTLGVPLIMTASYSNNVRYVARNGVVTSNSPAPAHISSRYDYTSNKTVDSPILVIGSISSGTPSTNNYDGLISEIIVYDRDLDAHEKVQIEEYLSEKYGIALGS